LIEGNTAFANGNHGFIISRGCTGFVFRRNRSYGNSNPDPTRLAHGFMIDAGSPTSADPQAPSTNNLLEANEAYDNEGYGLRILGSGENIVRGNSFARNQLGVSVEAGSDGNLIESNSVAESRSHGIVLRQAARTGVSGNSVAGSGGHGVYLLDGASDGRIASNRIEGSAGSAIRASGAEAVRNSWSENLIAGSGAQPIAVTGGANGGVRPPTIAEFAAGRVSGAAAPGAQVELFSVGPDGAAAFAGRTEAGADGGYSFAIDPLPREVMLVATDGAGNSSASATQAGRTFVYMPLVVR
jgi:parallel beta-helix repeat protein